MEISYGIMCRRKRQKKPPFNLPPFLWRAPALCGFIDTAECVRYAFEFTQGELSLLRGTDEPPHGRRKASYPRTGFFRVVQPAGSESAARRLRAGTRLYDRAALRLGAVGKHSTGTRSPV